MMKLVWVFLPLCVCTVNGWLFDGGTFGFSNSDQHQTSNTWQTSCVVCQDVYVPEGKRILKLSPCDTAYPQKFKDYDKNKNKKITLEELAETTKCSKGEMSTDFDEADKNDDGFIDMIEFQFAPFYYGQKDHARFHRLKDVGEWVSDLVKYQNKKGRKSVTFKVTKVKERKPKKKNKE